MKYELYFIPIIRRAINESRSFVDWDSVFEEIAAKRTDPLFAQGWESFSAFMDKVREAPEVDETIQDRGMTESSGKRTHFEEKEINRIPDQDEGLDQDTGALTSSSEIVVFLEGEGLGRQPIAIGELERSVTFSGIRAGSYRLEMFSGREIWSETIDRRDLLWACGAREEPLRLAADSSGAKPEEPTLEYSLLGGEIEIRILAGRDSGRLEIRKC